VIAILINPISGTGGRVEVARARAEQAAALVARHGLHAEVYLTERRGHGHELARAAVLRGARTVVAWGGDGTVNEVGSALVRSDAALAIVPAGSGNGLARELKIPRDTAGAFAVALGGTERRMDAGELDGRLFFNVAGIGFDARVAERFAAEGALTRGFRRYASIALRELVAYEAEAYAVQVDREVLSVTALMIAVANSRQYGNGAIIAPSARIDDGRLDVIIVGARSPARALLQIPRLFAGQVARVQGVLIRQGEAVRVSASRDLRYHVDGEPFTGAPSIDARIHPTVLRVKTPS
jgi:YegS/Rv2252/BmrU family lipid kinase